MRHQVISWDNYFQKVFGNWDKKVKLWYPNRIGFMKRQMSIQKAGMKSEFRETAKSLKHELGSI